MNQSKYKGLDNDRYNQGPLVQKLEDRVAKLLGKPQAMFFNKGTTCQLAALKAICVANKNKPVILHPKSHIALDEQDAYQALMGIKGIQLGSHDAPFSTLDLKAIQQDVAVLTVELPLRRIGFKLTAWKELLKMRQWCDANQVHFHMDGARLWESAPYYDKTLAEVSALFDSVYVSLYKGIGGLSGALLLGSDTFIASCDVWRNRLGSNMWSTFPALITGLEGLDKNLSQIPLWVSRAKEIAKSLRSIKTLLIDAPHTNGFRLKIKNPADDINEKLSLLSQQFELHLCTPFVACEDHFYSEIQVGAKHEKISNNEILLFFQQLLEN